MALAWYYLDSTILWPLKTAYHSNYCQAQWANMSTTKSRWAKVKLSKIKMWPSCNFLQSDLKGMVKELIYEVKYQSSARPRGPKTSYHLFGFYPYTKVRLGMSKKVLRVPIAHWTSKLQDLKVFTISLCTEKCNQKLWGGVTLKPLEPQDVLAPFWIPPASL